jgi:hypothetical protein
MAGGDDGKSLRSAQSISYFFSKPLNPRRLCLAGQCGFFHTVAMESHEVLRRALRKTSPKAVAADLGVSLSLVYKWTEKPGHDGTGSRNPLDRVLQIIDLSGDTSIVDWLCQRQGGHFVIDTKLDEKDSDHVLPATQEIIGRFSALLVRISEAANDHSVTAQEADEIRECWDQLKGYAEGFVRACERGIYK